VSAALTVRECAMSTLPLPADFLPAGAEGDAVIIKPSSLGDVVHTLPAVAWLRQAWPGLRLHWVVNTEWAPLLQGSPLLESVIAFPRGEFRGLGGLLRARRWFREYEAAMGARSVRLALDFQGLLRSAWLARKSTAPVILGLDDAREGSRFFYRAQVPAAGPRGEVRHSVDRYLGLVRALGPGCDEREALAGDWLPAGDPVAGLPGGGFIVLHPFARGAGKSLGWAAVALLAAAWREFPVVVVGRTGEPPPPDLPPNVVNLVNATRLLQLIAVLRGARFVVSVDSGPMHLASALHRPLLGVHTWSDPRKVGPYDPAARVWKAGRIVRRSEVDEALAGRDEVPDDAALRQMAEYVRSELRDDGR
jgi:heptosyltransferase-1